MELEEKVENLPTQPGVYVFKDVGSRILYVGKAASLRHRVRSYFAEGRVHDAKTGSLVREIADVDYIVVDNEREALALENNLIKQHKPRFNVLLRDDKTYPYIRFTAFEKFPRVYVTRRLRKDGSIYFGPYFPASLAYRIVDLIHKRFRVPSCTVDLSRPHPRPCLEFYIHRCHGPCSPGLVTDAKYAEAARDVKMFLDGRRSDLLQSLEARMREASKEERFEEAAKYRDLIRTVRDIEERQKVAAAEGDDTDVIAFCAEPPLVAVNLFHLRRGRVVDRRDFYWEDLSEFQPEEFLSALLKQLYLEAHYLPRFVHVPLEVEDGELLEALLSERAGRRVEIVTPRRGAKRAFLELVEKNARHSFEQRFRVQKPPAKLVTDALVSAFNLPAPPKRIESFDISHIAGADTVASMVVWEDGRMKKSGYRKFIIRGAAGNDDFASLREAVARRYARLQAEKTPMPGLILIDGGLGQLHAAAAALEELEIINQPLASIAKKEEVIYLLGQEDEPLRLDRHSPLLRLVQMIRDETHRFAVTFHRQRRTRRHLHSELLEIPGIGARTAEKLLRRFGSVAAAARASDKELHTVLSDAQFRRFREHAREKAGENAEIVSEE
jgi:excinuclease ABC subunit C